MLSKEEIVGVAHKQLALDYCCEVEDFYKKENTIGEKILISGRRIYDSDNCYLKILCINGNVIISTNKNFIPWCKENYETCGSQWFSDCANLRRIDNELQKHGHEIADIHHYYLPNTNKIEQDINFSVKWFEENEIIKFRGDDRFDEAFAFDKNHPDVLGVAAMDGDTIMGMAGASEDSSTMWQIGIDVLPEYRGRGIASKLVNLLKEEVLKRGKVPFYGTAESHIFSQNVAINAGFFPAWLELYSKCQ